MKNQFFSELNVVGLNHQTAPVEMRERVSFDPVELRQVLQKFYADVGVSDVLILSTCNRTEIYFSGAAVENVEHWIASYFSIAIGELSPSLYNKKGVDVYLHASRVASGVDSMVLGETQILGQMKESFRLSQSSSVVSWRFNKLFESVFSSAKAVRSGTRIGANAISLAAAAVRVLKNVFSKLEECSVLFVGAGEMIQLCANHFSQINFQNIVFSNRSVDRAKELAIKHTGEYFGFEKLSDNLFRFDIIVTCTASPIPIIGKGALEMAIRARKHRPLLIFDLAVPRDVETSASEIDDVFLFSVDDLGEIIKAGRRLREASVLEAQEIIQKKSLEFSTWVESRDSMSLVMHYRDMGESFCKAELDIALEKLSKGEDPSKVATRLANSLKNKFLDRPSRVLHQARGSQRDDLSLALAKLFNLDDQI